jgi:hypothetical protein
VDVYLLLPAPGWGILSGRPLGAIGATLLLLVWWSRLVAGRAPFGALALALVALKFAAGPLLLDRGLVALYYANDQWRPPHERSLDFLALPATMVDTRLDFHETRRPFPVFFFNDSSRFNYHRSGEPERRLMAFSAIWRGWMRTVGDRDWLFYLATAPAGTGGGAEASLAVDGHRLLTVDRGSARAEAPIALGPGWHAIEAVRKPYGATARLSAGLRGVGGDQPLGSDRLYAGPVPGTRLAADHAARALSWILDAIAVAALAGGVSACIAGAVGPVWRWALRARTRSCSRPSGLRRWPDWSCWSRVWRDGPARSASCRPSSASATSRLWW